MAKLPGTKVAWFFYLKVLKTHLKRDYSMDQIKNHKLLKTICIALIVTFIFLDISYAYPPEHNVSDSTLATPSVLQQTPINEQAVQLQQSVLSQGKLLGAVCSIGKYFLEDKLPIKYLEQVISAELGRAVENIDLSRVTIKDGVVLVPCVMEGKKRIVQIALKSSPAVKNLVGYEWPALDKYVIRELPEDYKETAKEKANTLLTLSKRAIMNRHGQVIMNFLAARESYDVRSGKWASVSGEHALIESGPFDAMLVLGSSDERVPKEAVVIAKKLREHNPAMTIITSGKWGYHVGAVDGLAGHYVDKDGKRIPEAEHFKRIMDALGASVDLVEDRSTNSGQNIQFSRDKLNGGKLFPKKILIVQTPELQLRAGRSLVLQYPKENQTLDSVGVQSVTSYSPYIPDLSLMSDEQALLRIQTSISELQRLPEYSGKFMVPVDVPTEVLEAEKALQTLIAAQEILPERYEKKEQIGVKGNERIQKSHSEIQSIIDASEYPENILDHYTSFTDEKLRKETIFLKDHMERVAGIASKIGEKIGLSPEDMKILMAAAYGHDAGTDMLPSVWKDINDAKVDTNLEKTRSNIRRNPDKADTLLSLPDFIVYAEKLMTERKGTPLTDEEKYLIELQIEDDYIHGENSVEFLSNFYIIPEEVAILIRCHKDYESFIENIESVKDPERVELLLSILITADAFEGINARTSKTFEEAFGDIRKKGLKEEPLNALKALLKENDNELLDIILKARKMDKLTPEDEVFLKLSNEKEFKNIFSSYQTIKEAETNGWLDIAIPHWKELKTMQQWGPHDDTVAAHTLGALEVLSQNESLRSFRSTEDAFIMAFFHDFGKEFYNPDYKKSLDQKYSDIHNIRGAKLVFDILFGFGFSEEYAKKIACYVKYHHVMWHLAYKGGIEANITDANKKETTSSFLDELTEGDIDIFTMLFCAEMKQIGTWDLGSNSESILKVSDQLKRFVNEIKNTKGENREQKIAQFMKVLINAANERNSWVEKSIRFISPGVMAYPGPDQIEEVFRSLDEEIVSHGIFGVIPAYRYNYIRLLMDNTSLIDGSKYLSIACKNDLRKLSDEDRQSFASVANCILLDILNGSSKEGIGHSLPVVSGLDYMPNSPTILLVAPFEKKKLKAGSFLAPPLGIYRLANYLRLFGIKADIFDPNLKGGKERGAEELCDFIRKQNAKRVYDFIGFSIYEPTLENDIELAREVKNISGESIFIAGGEGAFYNSEKLLTSDTPFNAIYKGFGEASMLDTLISYMQKGKENLYGKDEARKIKSATVKLKTGEVIETPLQSMITKDDYRVISLFFDSTIVPYEDYWSFMEGLYVYGSAEVKTALDINAIKTVRLITSSHCPMGCSFCSSTNFLNDSIGEKRQRVLSLTPQEIIKILKNIKKYHPETSTIFFNDDDFMIYPERVKELCGLIKQEFGENRFRFIALGRVDKVDKELLEKMQSAGFIQINYGIESFSDKVLLDMNKKINSSKNMAGLDSTLDSGIVPLINLILFYPTATKEDALFTIRTSVEFAAKGAELSYWPFVEAFRGASITRKVKSDKNPEGEYELSENGKDILPVDIEMRSLAREAIRNKDAVIQEIKAKYAIKGKIPHVVDVLAFFVAFYEAAGENTDNIYKVIESRIGKLKSISEELNDKNSGYNELDLSGDSRFLSGKLLAGNLSQYDAEILKKAILKKYREEQKVGAIEKIRYPHDNNDWESAGNALAKARKTYTETGRPLFLEGVTLIYKPRDNKYGLFRGAIEKMNIWNTAEEKPLIATVAVGSEHITLYDLACMLDWKKKYKNQFNHSAKDEIDKRTKELFNTGRFETEDRAREQATYEILTKKVDKVLKNFKADRVPVFKPSNIAISMPPCGPFAILLSMEPKTAEDLAIVTKIQDAIRDETGIENTGAFKAHITLGYVVNSVYKDEKVFKEFMQHIAELDAYIREQSALPKHEFISPQIELCYLDNLDNYQSIATFSWIGSNTDVGKVKFNHSYNPSIIPQLFTIAESSVNNERAKFIEVGNKIITAITTKIDLQSIADIGNLDKKMATAEIRQRVERAISVIEGLEKEKVSPEIITSIDLLKKSLNQFEADGAVGALIVLARRAQRENQKLIIGLETDWMPGTNVKSSLQRNAIAALMKEIDEIGEALKSMGLDNVEVIRESGKDLASILLIEADKTHTSLHNIVVMASTNTINSDSFAALRQENENNKPFLAGIDPTELIKLYAEFGEATSKQLYIRLTQMLYITLELAAGKEPPQLPIIASYDKNMRIVIFLPKAEPMDYEILKNTYTAEKMALSAC